MLLRFFRKRVKLIKYAFIAVIILIFYVIGAHQILFESSYDPTNFVYPFDVPNLLHLVEQHKSNLKPDVAPLNEYNYVFKYSNEKKCKKKVSGGESNEDEDVTILFVIKSAVNNRKRRAAIRLSWGFENRFSDVHFRRIFMVGSCDGLKETCQEQVDAEIRAANDLVQADFVDNYFNNTIKMMMSYKWILRYCPQARFILFVDDDYYVSSKNLLNFVRNPFAYKSKPDLYSKDPFAQPAELPPDYDGRLYAGYVFPSSRPKRDKLSKWSISLEEYKYSRYPPYVTAGAIVLSRLALMDMFYASLYTKHFRFDDIHVAILAKRVGIQPFHCEDFYFYKKSYSESEYSNVIASHGFNDVHQLLSVWEEQKSLGNA